MTTRILFCALILASAPAFAAKPCEELKGEITAQIEANHVPSYTLDIVDNDQVGDRTVVGSCDGGTRKIVYTRGAATPAAPQAEPTSATPAPTSAGKADTPPNTPAGH